MTEIWNLNTLCRCCHADGEFKSLETQYKYRNELEIYSVYLRDTFGIWINPPTFEASYSICEECIVRLRDANRFKNQVLQCEQKFQEYCQNQEFLTEQSIDIKNENDSDNDLGCDTNTEVENNEIVECKKEIEIKHVKPNDNVKDEDSPELVKKEKLCKKQTKVKTKVTGKNIGKTVKTKAVKPKKIKKSVETHIDLFRLIVKTEHGAQISCLKCGEVFQDEDDFEKHIKVKHSNPFQCTQCQEIYQDEIQFRNHLLIHRKQFFCSFCKLTFLHPNACKMHIIAHTKTEKYICDYCQKVFNYKYMITKHITLTHMLTQKDFVCETCGHAFRHKGTMKIHIEAVHEKLRKYSCTICPKKYSTRKNFVAHMHRHAGIKTHKCDQCPKEFYASSCLISHRKRKHKKPGEELLSDERKGEKCYKCKYCAFVGENSDGLRIHTRTHQGLLPHKCPICQKGFTCQYSMRRHIESHSGIKRHECDICHKKFSQKSLLKKHKQNIHEKVKPTEKFKCDICKVWVYDMQKHLRCHTDRPFSCHLCEKNYSAKNSLTRHIDVDHNGRRQFKCNLCPKGYSQNRNLVKHKLKVHKVVHKEEENYDEALVAHTIDVKNVKKI